MTVANIAQGPATVQKEQCFFECSMCRRALSFDHAVEICPSCKHVFERSARGQRDFRVPPTAVLSYELAYTPLRYDQPIDIPIYSERRCPEQRNRYEGTVPNHLTADQISYFPQALAGQQALDLGCGNGVHREVLERLGYRVRGADFAGAAAEDLVDAHALPYVGNAFDFVLSIAVLEHLAHPMRALAEVHRVLKPSGCFIGTVAFLEPFHDNSFHHFTHLGLWSALRNSGFAVDAIMPIHAWDVFRAQLAMGFGGHLPAPAPRILSMPFVWALRLYAAAGRLLSGMPLRHSSGASMARHAGGFFFVAYASCAGADRELNSPQFVK